MSLPGEQAAAGTLRADSDHQVQHSSHLVPTLIMKCKRLHP